MLASLRLAGFRSYADSGWLDFRPLTIITGPNNSGKSTLLDAILLLKQTFQHRTVREPLVTSGPYADLGSFHDILRGGRSASRQTLSISLKLVPSLAKAALGGERLEDEEQFPDQADIRFAFSQRANRIYVTSSRLLHEGDVVYEVRPSGRGWGLRKGVSEEAKRSINVDLFHFIPRVTFGEQPPQTQEAFQEVLQAFTRLGMQISLWGTFFENVHHVAPLRQPVPRFSTLGTVATDELGAGGENVLQALAGLRESAEGKEMFKKLDFWVREHLEFLERLRLVPIDSEGSIWALHGDETDGLPAINVANMGEGVSQLLPILISVLTSRPHETLLIEQPEIHLHPAAQAELGDLFADSLERGELRQFIVETHSEHLLLRIRRHVAEGKLSPDRVQILYVDKARGVSRVQRLPLDQRGHFEWWPEGFFEEGYREAMDLAEAAARSAAKRSR